VRGTLAELTSANGAIRDAAGEDALFEGVSPARNDERGAVFFGERGGGGVRRRFARGDDDRQHCYVPGAKPR